MLHRKLPHYILSHDELGLHRALHTLQNHLTKFESDLVIAETDPWYFYSFADFRSFSIGVGAQSTSGGTSFLPEIYV